MCVAVSEPTSNQSTNNKLWGKQSHGQAKIQEYIASNQDQTFQLQYQQN